MQIFPVTTGEVPLLFESSCRDSTRTNLKQSLSRENFIPCAQKITLAAFKITRAASQIIRADNEIIRADNKISRARGKMLRAR